MYISLKLALILFRFSDRFETEKLKLNSLISIIHLTYKNDTSPKSYTKYNAIAQSKQLV